MRKLFIFVLGIAATVILVTVVVKINSSLKVFAETVEVTEVDSTILPADSILFPDGMTEEVFINEMKKGVQGDYTLEQVDSMYKSWAEQGNDFGD